MDDSDRIAPGLHLAAVYRRRVRASLRRVWENVFDWEHLPALHASSFQSAELLERRRDGWKLRLVNQPGDPARAQILELRADKAAGSYVAATLEGPGAGSEVRTRLAPQGEHKTAIEVEFHVPEGDPQRLARIGQAYLATYARLWSEDEAMMIARERAIAARRRRRPAVSRPRLLGALAALRERLPLILSFAGERFRIVEMDGELVIHAAVCPHWLGPLDAAPVIDGCVRCPWHGYRFNVRSGANADGLPLALATPPQISVRDGYVTLRPAPAPHQPA